MSTDAPGEGGWRTGLLLLGALLALPAAGLELIPALEAAPRGNAAREAAAIELFNVHCPELELRRIPRTTQRNVVCALPGAGAPVLVAAHYDRIGAGAGVVDNWSGLVMTAELLREFSSRRRRSAFVFVATGAEETGMRGALALAREMTPRAMVNVDTVGLREPRVDPRSDRDLRELAHSEAARLGMTLAAPRIRWMSGDWEPFKRRGVPVLNLHSLRPRDERAVHTRRDRVERINVDHWERTLLLTSRILWKLDRQQNRGEEL